MVVYLHAMIQTLSAARIFTGEQWLYDSTIEIEDGLVLRILPSSGRADRHVGEGFLAPAFVDAQVYGAGGRLLSVFPGAETLQVMANAFARTGTALFQPTVATNTPDVFRHCIDAVRAYWSGGGKGVHGLHLEGPWIHPARRGAHVAEFVHPPTREEVESLLEYGKGVVTMITLAPEVCDPTLVQMIRQAGIVVSAGHTQASYEEAMQAFDGDVTAVTHLYNAMSPLGHRAPGVVGACFNHPSIHASIIPDGHHVDFAAIRIAKKLMGSRLFAITDAVTETSEGPYRHQLAGDKYEANGVLSGSAISMQQACMNLVKEVGIGIEEAVRMCSTLPAEVIGANAYGKIAAGCQANFVVLNEGAELIDRIA